MEVYWALLVPYVVFMICLDLLRVPEGSGGVGKILKRVVFSMLLLFSFEECMNVIAMISDGITEKINGVTQLKDLLKHLSDTYNSTEVNWLKFREAVLYIVSLISYIIAYLGVFVADVLIHFVWSILYIISPLMILMYVSEKTAFVTASLYKGLINVVTWKVLWSILGVILLKLATSPQAASSDNFINAVLMNLCIGICMLLIPKATKSLLSDGLSSMSEGLAAMPTTAAFNAAKLYTMRFAKGAAMGAPKEVLSGFKGTRAVARAGYEKVKSGVQTARRVGEKAKHVAQKVRGFSEMRSPRPIQSPFDPKGPFGSGRDRILRGKE